MRYAATRYDDALVDTCSVTVSPWTALTRSAKPSIVGVLDGFVIRHSVVPGFAFSVTTHCARLTPVAAFVGVPAGRGSADDDGNEPLAWARRVRCGAVEERHTIPAATPQATT